MDKALDDFCISLEKIAENINSLSAPDAVMTEQYGWNCPALTFRDLAFIPSDLARRLRATEAALPADLSKRLPLLTRQVGLLQAHTVPQLPGGNAMPASEAIIATFAAFQGILSPLTSWEAITDTKALPPNLARRIRSYNAELDTLVPNKEKLANQLKSIEDATSAAESLPTDLAALEDARNTVETIGKAVSLAEARIQELAEQSKASAEAMHANEVQATKLVDQCEQAYRITTTKGLAAAFDQRASRLALSMWAWVVGLVVALGLAAYAGALRVALLTTSIVQPEPHWGVIAMHVVLSILSVGAPLWFAWLATRQIGQRFVLAEDYGFKASVAKAYEGYRKEAARIDPHFESRLFSSALDRLEEAPLRFIEPVIHGSPGHELLNSAAVRSAIERVPGFKDALGAALRRVGGASSSEPPLAPTKPSSPAAS